MYLEFPRSRDEHIAKWTDEKLVAEEKRLGDEWNEDNPAHHSAAGAFAQEMEVRGIVGPPIFETKWKIKDHVLRLVEHELKEAGASEEHLIAARKAIRKDKSGVIEAWLRHLVACAQARGERIGKGTYVEDADAGRTDTGNVQVP